MDFQNSIFFAADDVGGLICINIPNFIKIGQTVADISHYGVKIAKIGPADPGIIVLLFIIQPRR